MAKVSVESVGTASVTINTPSSEVSNATSIQVAEIDSIGLEGGTLTETLNELQTEINDNTINVDLSLIWLNEIQ